MQGAGSVPQSIQLQKQQALLEQLTRKLNLQVDDHDIAHASVDDLKTKVDDAVAEVHNKFKDYYKLYLFTCWLQYFKWMAFSPKQNLCDIDILTYSFLFYCIAPFIAAKLTHSAWHSVSSTYRVRFHREHNKMYIKREIYRMWRSTFCFTYIACYYFMLFFTFGVLPDVLKL